MSTTVHIVEFDHPCDVSSLAADELARAATFRFETDRTRWLRSRTALREILGQALGIAPSVVPIVVTASGKPVLSGPHSTLHFNLSHCENLMLVALSHDGPVGIDVECDKRAPSLRECRESFLHPGEIARNPQAADLLQSWCAKEAILKACGCGLTIDPTGIFLSADRASVLAPARFSAYHLLDLRHELLAGHTAFFASEQPGAIRIAAFPHA